MLALRIVDRELRLGDGQFVAAGAPQAHFIGDRVRVEVRSPTSTTALDDLA
ncbi:hypothetical protein OKW43_001823 [Paraburkholderia sp. WC7.3g]